MGKIAILALVWGVFLSLPVISPADANPYGSISQRNVFGLREPPPPAPPPAEPPVAQDNAELLLTGVVDFQTAKWALLTSTERGRTPRLYTLGVGQREDNLEVLDINAESSTVRVRHGSAELVLTFETHGPPNSTRIEDPGRKYIQQAKPFVDEHTRAHVLREQREAERRAIERAAAEAEIAARQISTHVDGPPL